MAPSILLVDNDADSIAIYSLILKHHGYDVLAAHDGETGYQLAVDRRPNVVVSELYLPPVDGRSLYEQLRRNEGTASIPLILLDSIATYGIELGLEDEPAATRLTKPCEPSRLLMEVQKLLNMEMAVPAQ